MLISILGDSISTFEGYSEPYESAFYDVTRKCQSDILRVEQAWWGQVINYLNGELLVNNSISGSMVSKHHSCIAPTYGCSDERANSLHKNDAFPSVIMVYLGTNDWGHGVKLMPQNEQEKKDISIFSVAYDKMLEKLRINYPNAEIWCFTLAISGYKNGRAISFPYCFGGVHIEKYCDIIRQLAKKHNCRLIDLYSSAQPFDTIDGFHPNLDGMNTIASAVISQLRREKSDTTGIF